MFHIQVYGILLMEYGQFVLELWYYQKTVLMTINNPNGKFTTLLTADTKFINETSNNTP